MPMTSTSMILDFFEEATEAEKHHLLRRFLLDDEDKFLQMLCTTFPDPLDDLIKVIAMIEGRVPAIKFYKKVAQKDLKTAKEYVDALVGDF